MCVARADDDGVVLRPKTAVRTDPRLVALLRDGAGAKAGRARDFFLALATCNTIVPIAAAADDGAAAGERVLEYQGESPDEQALVYAAAAYGYTLVERTSGHIIVDVFGARQRYAPRVSSASCCCCCWVHCLFACLLVCSACCLVFYFF